MKEEVWRDISGYEGYYQVSSLGKVRSLDRVVPTKDGGERFCKGRTIEGLVNRGYRQVNLNRDSIGRTYNFSQLVAMAFLGHEPNGGVLVVDHINGNRSDNRVENLRIVTQRANKSICFRSNEDSFSSKYVGVNWHKGTSKWITQIRYGEAVIHLGLFTSETEASKAYQSALSKIKEGSFNPEDYKPKWTSKYKGVHFHKSSGKWQADVKIRGKQIYIGSFPTEILAHQAYQAKLKKLTNNK